MSHWDAVALGYQRSFARLCAGAIPFLLEGVADARGSRLLDAGCGTGELAAAARDAGYDVTAIDVSERMLALARGSHPGIRFDAGDLMDLPFADSSFDAATANFVVNHTIDPRRSLRELHRVLGPGGCSVISIWPYRVSALNTVWSTVLEVSGAAKPPIQRLPPDKDFDRTTNGLAQILSEADFTHVHVREVEWTLSIRPVDLWAGAEAGISVIGATYLAHDVLMRQRMSEAFYDVVRQSTTKGLLQFAATGIVAVGRA